MNRQHRRQSQGRGDAPQWVVPEDETDAGSGSGGGDDGRPRSGAATDPGPGGAEGGSVLTARQALAPSRHRVGPRQFLHEVNVEMRKVAWPTRAETINYSTVVLITLVLLMAMIFGLDIAFQHAANFVFNP
jgi:preprotein translocase subunit SecE